MEIDLDTGVWISAGYVSFWNFIFLNNIVDRFVWHLDHLIKKHEVVSADFIVFNTIFSFLANIQSLLLRKVTTDEPLKLKISHELSLEFYKAVIVNLFEVFDDFWHRGVSKHNLSENHAYLLIRFLEKSILICSQLLILVVFKIILLEVKLLDSCKQVFEICFDLLLVIIRGVVELDIPMMNFETIVDASLFSHVGTFAEVLFEHAFPENGIDCGLRIKGVVAVTCKDFCVNPNVGLIECVILFEPDFEVVIICQHFGYCWLLRILPLLLQVFQILNFRHIMIWRSKIKLYPIFWEDSRKLLDVIFR